MFCLYFFPFLLYYKYEFWDHIMLLILLYVTFGVIQFDINILKARIIYLFLNNGLVNTSWSNRQIGTKLVFGFHSYSFVALIPKWHKIYILGTVIYKCIYYRKLHAKYVFLHILCLNTQKADKLNSYKNDRCWTFSSKRHFLFLLTNNRKRLFLDDAC